MESHTECLEKKQLTDETLMILNWFHVNDYCLSHHYEFILKEVKEYSALPVFK